MNLKHLAYKSNASQEGWEIWQMLKLVKEITPKVIVEIGCDGGGFLETLTNVFPKAKIIGIDINERHELDRFNMIYGDSKKNETLQELKVKLDNKQIDFLFIDGDHTYEGVRADYQLYNSEVRHGGIIGFHDTNNRGLPGVEVDRFLNELDQRLSNRTADFLLHPKSPGTRIMWL